MKRRTSRSDFSALITFLVPTICYVSGVSAFESQGYFGTLCSFGFLIVYILISIAAPVYLRSLGKLNTTALLYSLFGTGFMMLPFLGTVGLPGSELFPPPVFPNNVLLWLFVAYMAIGLAWLLLQRARHPKMIPDMRSAIENVELQFANARSIAKRSIQ